VQITFDEDDTPRHHAEVRHRRSVGDVVNVTADPNRRPLDRVQFIAEHFRTTGAPQGHGFDPDHRDWAYYRIPSGPQDLFQFICLGLSPPWRRRMRKSSTLAMPVA
jgi:hypothetical protein